LFIQLQLACSRPRAQDDGLFRFGQPLEWLCGQKLPCFAYVLLHALEFGNAGA
jgi:hypothetical protein